VARQEPDHRAGHHHHRDERVVADVARRFARVLAQAVVQRRAVRILAAGLVLLHALAQGVELGAVRALGKTLGQRRLLRGVFGPPGQAGAVAILLRWCAVVVAHGRSMADFPARLKGEGLISPRHGETMDPHDRTRPRAGGRLLPFGPASQDVAP